MHDDARSWRLEDFGPGLDRWMATEKPPQQVVGVVTEWLFTRIEDPYQGVRRQPGFDNLWSGAVPGSYYGGTIVECSYWIEDPMRRVRCNMFGSLPV